MEAYYQLAVTALLILAGIKAVAVKPSAYYLGLAANLLLAMWLAQGSGINGLWLIVFTPLCFFTVVAPLWRTMRGLAPLVFLPLATIAILAFAVQVLGDGGVITQSAAPEGVESIVLFHILTAASAYGALAAAAAAGASILLREDALRSKKPPLLPSLPSLNDGERAEVRLLGFSIVMLVIALVSGSMAVDGWSTLYVQKAVFAGAALAVAVVSLGLRWAASSRGRKLARLVLLAWVLLTPAWPGLRQLWQ